MLVILGLNETRKQPAGKRMLESVKYTDLSRLVSGAGDVIVLDVRRGLFKSVRGYEAEIIRSVLDLPEHIERCMRDK